MVLADTSIWVDFSRRGVTGDAAAMARLLDSGEVSTCGPVAAEVLAGLEGETAERMWMTLDSLPWISTPSDLWREVGAVAHRLRRAGKASPLTDLAIAVAAARAGHALWSFDSDFERIAAVLPELDLYDAS
ncbi:MAG TPA: PIN domain-containing protein [Solirubrobacterales bacterium]|nr:PIN domain-containing protein [Solirubrobacterales bacterium]